MLIQTGIDWWKTVPSDWKECLFKDCITIFNGKDYKGIEANDGIPVIGSGGQFTYATMSMFNGEVVFLGRKGTIDRPLYYNGPFWAVDTMFYGIPIKGNNCKFLYYLATCFPFTKISTSTALPSMTQSDLANLVVFIPLLAEQEKIVAYLDDKCAEIDENISVLRQMKTKYSELKKSLIYNYVTTGINNQKFKSIECPWLNTIPEHWSIVEAKSFCNDIYAGATPSTDIEQYWDGDIPWIPSGCCQNSIIEQAPKFITWLGYQKSSTRWIPEGTTVMAMTGATCANVGQLKFRSCANQSVAAFVVNEKKQDSRFLFYLLIAARSYILTFQTGGAQAGINIQDCCGLKLPYPPLQEQHIISNLLDQKCLTIDTIIFNIDEQINKYQELKKSLINEVITGQRAV